MGRAAWWRDSVGLCSWGQVPRELKPPDRFPTAWEQRKEARSSFSSSLPDVTLSPWSSDSKCHQRRVLTYTIPISNQLGPKSASVVETQVGLGRRRLPGGLAPWSSPDPLTASSVPFRHCSGAAHRRAGAWWTLRCSPRASRTRTTSTLPTDTVSWVWPGTRPGFGDPECALSLPHLSGQGCFHPALEEVIVNRIVDVLRCSLNAEHALNIDILGLRDKTSPVRDLKLHWENSSE